MATVYLETTIPSYLVAEPSRDLVVAANQKITHDWWQTARERFDLLISEPVLDEIQAGDPDMAARRLEIIDDLPMLEWNEDVVALVQVYGARLGLSGPATADVQHIAFSVAYELDYLVTWNCAHIANGQVVSRLQELNRELNRFTPLIYTPQQILENSEGDQL